MLIGVERCVYHAPVTVPVTGTVISTGTAEVVYDDGRKSFISRDVWNSVAKDKVVFRIQWTFLDLSVACLGADDNK